MRIKLADLRSLILEYTAGPHLTLYHRSPEKFKVGDILSAQVEKSTGRHWLTTMGGERDLEWIREREFPDRPSRFNCVYATFTPRSRFINKGYLYAVKPIGKTHVADSELIDYLRRDSDSDVIRDYWEGAEPSRHNLNDLEILMDKAEVVEVVEEKRRVQRGDKFRVTSSSPAIVVELNVWAPKSADPAVHDSTGNSKITIEDAVELISSFPAKKISEETSEYRTMILFELLPGFEGTVIKSNVSDPGKAYSSNIDVSLTPGDTLGKGHGVYLTMDTSNNHKFVKALRNGSIERR